MNSELPVKVLKGVLATALSSLSSSDARAMLELEDERFIEAFIEEIRMLSFLLDEADNEASLAEFLKEKILLLRVAVLNAASDSEKNMTTLGFLDDFVFRLTPELNEYCTLRAQAF